MSACSLSLISSGVLLTAHSFGLFSTWLILNISSPTSSSQIFSVDIYLSSPVQQGSVCLAHFDFAFSRCWESLWQLMIKAQRFVCSLRNEEIWDYIMGIFLLYMFCPLWQADTQHFIRISKNYEGSEHISSYEKIFGEYFKRY